MIFSKQKEFKFSQRMDNLFSITGLNKYEIEILFTLLYSPANINEIYKSGKFSSISELKKDINSLLNKGLIKEQTSENGIKYKNINPKLLVDKTRTRNIEITPDSLKRWTEIYNVFNDEDFYGVVMNPYTVYNKKSFFDDSFIRRYDKFSLYYPKIEIKVIEKCNLDCLYCCDGSSMGKVTFNRCLYELEKAISLGIKNLIISGGEPTIWKKTPRLIEEAKRIGFNNIELFTNGLVFYIEGLLESYLEKGLTSLSVHISATEKSIYERLVSRANTFEIIEKSLKTISKFNQLSITIFTIINKLNLHHLNFVVDYFNEYQKAVNFKNFFHFLVFCCTFSKAWINRQIVLLKMFETSFYVKKILDRYPENESLFYVGIPICLMKGYEISNYDLYCVPARYLLKNKKIDYLQQDLLFTKTNSCHECIHNNYCVGIQRGYAMAYGLDEFVPVKK